MAFKLLGFRNFANLVISNQVAFDNINLLKSCNLLLKY
jgi:HD-like signal output (HDOD) protein